MNYVPGPSTLIEGIRKCRRDTFWNGGTGKRGWSRGGSWRRGRSAAGRWKRRKKNWTGCCATRVREHLVSDVPLGVWASGGMDSSTILHYAATQSAARLKTFSVSFAGPQLRRKPVFSRDRAGLRHGPPRVRSEPGRGTAERDRGLRLLLGRAERGRGGVAGVVPVAHEPAARDGGAIGRRRGRVIRRVSDLSRPTGWRGRSGWYPARLAAADAGGAGPVSCRSRTRRSAWSTS